MQVQTKQSGSTVGSLQRGNWRTWLNAKTAQTMKFALSQKTPSHKALLRQDWLSKATKVAVLGSLFSLAVLPEFANAALDFTAIRSMFKDIVTFLIYDVGYYLGIAAIAFCGFQAKQGRMSWGQFGWACAGIFLVFFAPSIVDSIREGAQTSLR
ncbi:MULTISPECIES: TrbC/VirB2 family protein [Pseudomonas]|uniref:Uncharacterized protein n=1 Tax=Pseudomonas syringae pv. actinidiae TaxID=103796 RepID=A0A2P0QF43_PSESF|nr:MULTISPECIES: TrbC/VirB2 family protein [Pseudomonas]APQ06989.1 hypothetical protein PsaNZ47_30070 [Pseudomonas syringae pv. actinidiae]ARO44972.1 hypothetical protein [Pseudomonas syringae pv. actinidiae]ARO45077.1 hypothetical protein [Pseudomonas syringae pv. actinidiae]ARO45168.1 hypothetical protein [Pseudomonas syringae pv. actinidiae]ARO45210.1 hypothetical protein [Pseudomonas syringae pv. actinidiae]